jgi:hypothetical protein
MDHRREPSPQNARLLTQTSQLSRRAVVAGTVTMTAVAAVLPLGTMAYADAHDADMVAFLRLSEALTGVNITTLAPEFTLANSGDILNSDPGVDPIQIKDDYFIWIKDNDQTSSFGKLLEIAKDHRQSATDIITAVNASDDNVRFLARSIVLLWYLGSWYKPEDLKNKVPSPKVDIPKPIVVSSKAYTQGLVWLIAGAHPMGYSNLQFGYWSRDPHDPDPKSPPLFNPANP